MARSSACNRLQLWVWILMWLQPVFTQTLTYNFMECLVEPGGVWPVHGASVWSQEDSSYTQPNFHCTIGFRLANPDMRFLVNFLLLDLPSSVGGVCQDTLTVWEAGHHGNTTLFGPLCGYLADLRPSKAYTQPGADVWIQWRTAARVTGTYTGFHIVLTAILPPAECTPEQHYLCETSHDCVSASLLCDEVPHCLDRSDETQCERHRIGGSGRGIDMPPSQPPLVGSHLLPTWQSDPTVTEPQVTATSKTTTLASGEETGGSGEAFQDVDMVSIIVVGVLFVVILLICVILACRSKGGSDMMPLSEETNQLRLDISSAQGISEADGLPATPPPTYSMIERQTSYVSQISMSSSQVSIPPDYDEALELDEHGNPRPRRTPSRHGSNSRFSFQGNTTGIRPVRSASGYSKSRPRVQRFQRSHSATDDPSSSRSRYLSQTSTISEVGPIDEDSVLDTADDIFQQSPTEPSSPAHSTSLGLPKCPVTSTPHDPSPYHIETIREDSRAPLFRLGGASDTSEEVSIATDPHSGSSSHGGDDSRTELTSPRRKETDRDSSA